MPVTALEYRRYHSYYRELPQLRDLEKAPKFFQVQSSFHTKYSLLIIKFSRFSGCYEFQQSRKLFHPKLDCIQLLLFNEILTIFWLMRFSTIKCNQLHWRKLLHPKFYCLKLLINQCTLVIVLTHAAQPIPISCDICLSNNSWTLKHHHLECFKVNSWKKFPYLEIKPLCICTSQKLKTPKNFSLIIFRVNQWLSRIFIFTFS